MPRVFVIPVYVELTEGFERAVAALESHLRRAGYAFHTGEPVAKSLEEAITAGPTPTSMSGEHG